MRTNAPVPGETPASRWGQRGSGTGKVRNRQGFRRPHGHAVSSKTRQRCLQIPDGKFLRRINPDAAVPLSGTVERQCHTRKVSQTSPPHCLQDAIRARAPPEEIMCEKEEDAGGRRPGGGGAPGWWGSGWWPAGGRQPRRHGGRGLQEGRLRTRGDGDSWSRLCSQQRGASWKFRADPGIGT